MRCSLSYSRPCGVHGAPDEAARLALEAGFDGLEAAVPEAPEARDALGQALSEHGVPFIAEVCTGGSYVPDRHATPAEHLADLRRRCGPPSRWARCCVT